MDNAPRTGMARAMVPITRTIASVDRINGENFRKPKWRGAKTDNLGPRPSFKRGHAVI
jgi:hypothetical protein